MTEVSDQIQYHSLADIRMRKETIRKDIEKDEVQINKLWGSLFHKPAALSNSATASKRLNSLLSIGMGALDGTLLVWKLYRRFKRK